MIKEEEDEEERGGEEKQDIMLSLHLPLFIAGIQPVRLILTMNMAA